MSRITLGVGELAVTKTRGDELATLGLGSCVAVIMLAHQGQTIGMAHVALPDASTDPGRARTLPGYFAGPAVDALIAQMAKAGAPLLRRITVKLVGGANIMDPDQLFNIGKRNVLEIKKALWRHGMGPLAEDVGEGYSRSVRVIAGAGRVIISSPSQGTWEI